MNKRGYVMLGDFYYKKIYLNNFEEKKKIIDTYKISDFESLLKELEGIELLQFFDDDTINYYCNSQHTTVSGFLEYIITCTNSYKSKLLCDSRMIRLLIKKRPYNIYYLDEQVVTQLFYILLKEFPDEFNMFSYIDTKIQFKILTNIENLKHFIDHGFDYQYLFRIKDADILNFVLNLEIYKEGLLNVSNRPFLDFLAGTTVIPNYMISDIRFRERFNKIDSVSYRKVIKHLYEFIELPIILELEHQRDTYYDSVIDDAKNDLIYPYSCLYDLYSEPVSDEFVDMKYNLIDSELRFKIDAIEREYKLNFNEKKNKLYALLKFETNDNFFDIFVDRFFKDIPYDFYQNLIRMIDYVDKNNVNLIPNDRLEIYRKIIDFDKLSFTDKIKLYKEMKGYDWEDIFYDDYRAVKNNSYQGIKSSLIGPDELAALKNDNESKLRGVDVFELTGEPFKALVHCTKTEKSCASDFEWERKGNSDGLCCSLIGDKHLGILRDNNIIVGFFWNQIDVDKIVHSYRSDSYSSYNTSYNQAASNHIVDIMNSDDFLEETIGFNEIIYKTYDSITGENENVYPGFVMCYDTITEGDELAAKKLGVPIVLVHTKYYKKRNSQASFAGVDENVYSSIYGDTPRGYRNR